MVSMAATMRERGPLLVAPAGKRDGPAEGLRVAAGRDSPTRRQGTRDGGGSGSPTYDHPNVRIESPRHSHIEMGARLRSYALADAIVGVKSRRLRGATGDGCCRREACSEGAVAALWWNEK